LGVISGYFSFILIFFFSLLKLVDTTHGKNVFPHPGDRHSGPVIQARSIQALGLNVV
jgi:hypothetical protein